MDNIRYWSEKGITFQTFRYDYGINRISSKSADKYIDSLKRQIFNRDVNLDINVSDFPHVIVVRAAAKKSMFYSRDSFIDFVLANRDELNDTIQKSIDDLKSGFMD